MLNAILAAALLVSAPALQQGDTTFPVDPRGRLQMEGLRRDVTIRTWDRPEIRVNLEEDEREWLRIQAGSPTVRIGFSPLSTVRGVPSRSGGAVQLTIPATMSIRLAGPHGDVSIEGTQGEVSVEAVEGDITLRGGRGLVSLRSVQGDITARDVQGNVEVHTVNGDVRLSSVTGDLAVDGISSDVMLADIDAASVTVTTVSGDVSFDGKVRERGRYAITAHSGDITFSAPQGMNALIGVSTFSGDFQSDVPVQLNEQRMGKRFTFTLGSGSAQVELKSFSGDIHLQRRSAPDAGQ